MTTYWIETLGCSKNAVDSAKLRGLLEVGLHEAEDLATADVIIVNTCAFIEEARLESLDALADAVSERKAGAAVVATGCMAQRDPDRIKGAVPGVELVAPFGQLPVPERVAVELQRRPAREFDLLSLDRPRTSSSWAYVKLAEGCDRRCGFCAIPLIRGPQRSRPASAVLEEVHDLAAGGVKEVVLVAQDPVNYGVDRSERQSRGPGPTPLEALLRRLPEVIEWTRVVYLYPSGITPGIIDAVVATGVPYFDLSLQHASKPLLRAMRRWGDAERFLPLIERIRRTDADAVLRSTFVVGYPGETEEDHLRLIRFLEAAELDWAGFFAYSPERGTAAHSLPNQVDRTLALERVAECTEVQEVITSRRRDALVGTNLRVLVDDPGVGRSVHEAPEIDGIIELPAACEPGTFVEVTVTESLGVDLRARPA